MGTSPSLQMPTWSAQLLWIQRVASRPSAKLMVSSMLIFIGAALTLVGETDVEARFVHKRDVKEQERLSARSLRLRTKRRADYTRDNREIWPRSRRVVQFCSL